MALKISTVQATRTGAYLVNKGPMGIEVSLDPHANDPNAEALLNWLRSNRADPWSPSLDEAKARALSALPGWIDEFLSPFTSKYPKHERDAWPLLAIAAKAHLAGQSQQMILNEAAIIGDAPEIVAERIVQKSTLFSTIVDHARGLRQRTEAAVELAATAAEVDDALAIARGHARDMLDAILSRQATAEL